jgi:asparagine synthase (glutamine-hydrolysing)
METSSSAERRFASTVQDHGYRVLLSGVGGDEVLGGVPTPVPELADLLACGRLRTLIRQLKAWALAKRRPWFHLLLETLNEFLPKSLAVRQRHEHPPDWLTSGFVHRNHAAFENHADRFRLFSLLPSFQDNLNTLEILRRQIAFSSHLTPLVLEHRYPYLDRDLPSFITRFHETNWFDLVSVVH